MPFTTSHANAIARAMVSDARQHVRDFSERLALLPHGLRVVDWDFFTAADGPQRERDAQIDNMKCCVVTAKWDGRRFVRVRRISGRLSYERALQHVRERAAGLGLPSADDVRLWAEGRDSNFKP